MHIGIVSTCGGIDQSNGYMRSVSFQHQPAGAVFYWPGFLPTQSCTSQVFYPWVLVPAGVRRENFARRQFRTRFDASFEICLTPVSNSACRFLTEFDAGIELKLMPDSISIGH